MHRTPAGTSGAYGGRRLGGLVAALAVATALTASLAAPAGVAAATPAPVSHAWSFGVMDDTQWTTTDPAGANPRDVAVSIISQVNSRFIAAGVRFVVQVGDLTENGNDADIVARAAAAKPLLDAGIGFFPMRGNHETYGSPANSFSIPAFQAAFPQTRGLSDTFGATKFSSPTSVSSDLNGMSYSFDYGTPGDSARFVVIDSWVTPSKKVSPGNGYDYGYSIGDQQSWISSRLDASTRGTTHAFVFSHQPLIAENHQDSPFVGQTYANPPMQNAFLASLQANGVRYYISGHDHINQRSIITSPDGASTVEQIIGASDSSKFYTPKPLSNAGWSDPVTLVNQKTRETSLAQDAYTVGYYIYTVDGPRVTVTYYADDHGGWKSDNCYPDSTTGTVSSCKSTDAAGSHVTPTLHFVKKQSWGYSLNGKEFLFGGGPTNGTGIDHGTDYRVIRDGSGGTAARILSGNYDNVGTDLTGRALVQAVDTGWTASKGVDSSGRTLASNIFTLWGMAPVGAPQNALGEGQTNLYTLSLSYRNGEATQLGTGSFGIATRGPNGKWVNAVDLNIGGTPTFVKGPWRADYGLGTYGVDPSTKTVWAVLDYNGDFAAANGVRPVTAP